MSFRKCLSARAQTHTSRGAAGTAEVPRNPDAAGDTPQLSSYSSVPASPGKTRTRRVRNERPPQAAQRRLLPLRGRHQPPKFESTCAVQRHDVTPAMMLPGCTQSDVTPGACSRIADPIPPDRSCTLPTLRAGLREPRYSLAPLATPGSAEARKIIHRSCTSSWHAVTTDSPIHQCSAPLIEGHARRPGMPPLKHRPAASLQPSISLARTLPCLISQRMSQP